jgi:hypothetical protein
VPPVAPNSAMCMCSIPLLQGGSGRSTGRLDAIRESQSQHPHSPRTATCSAAISDSGQSRRSSRCTGRGQQASPGRRPADRRDGSTRSERARASTLTTAGTHHGRCPLAGQSPDRRLSLHPRGDSGTAPTSRRDRQHRLDPCPAIRTPLHKDAHQNRRGKNFRLLQNRAIFYMNARALPM